MPVQLPDPRRFDAGKKSQLSEAADEVAAAPPAEQKLLLRKLSRHISTMLEQGDEQIVRDALREPSSSQACRWLLQALDTALSPNSNAGGVHVSVFAIPVLFVVGGTSSARIAGTLSDSGEIQALFESAGALGHCRNFGMSNALASLESIQAIPWAALHSVSHSDTWDGLAGLDLPPADINVAVEKETVQLRFIAGAALTPSSAPGFVEAASDIGRWGISMTKLLGRQLATQGASLLAIPRSPGSVLRAAQEGWFAARELGFQLFLSNALRHARLGVGEPDVSISACSDETIRIRLTSPFDELFDQTYGWPLSLSDDFEEIAGSISALLDEAKVERVEVAPTIEEVTDANKTSH